MAVNIEWGNLIWHSSIQPFSNSWRIPTWQSRRWIRIPCRGDCIVAGESCTIDYSVFPSVSNKDVSTPTCRRSCCASAALVSAPPGPGCRRTAPAEAPVATPSIRVNHHRAAAGSPIDLTYTFVVAKRREDPGDYRVMLHVVDTDEELMWTDDHNPPVADQRVETWRDRRVHAHDFRARVPVRRECHASGGSVLDLGSAPPDRSPGRMSASARIKSAASTFCRRPKTS